MKQFIEEHHICCPTCGKFNWTDIRQFKLMFKTFQGVTEDAKNTVYLRPETAQGIFVNFQNVQRTTRRKLPFGVCQVGILGEIPSSLQNYIDYEAYGRDLDIEGTFIATNAGICEVLR